MDRKRVFMGVLALLCLLLLSALAHSEVCCIYRIRPVLESADAPAGEGAVRIGLLRGQSRAAQITLGPQARSASGKAVDLGQLLKERNGRVVRASWRVQVRYESKEKGSFLLWPRGNREGIIRQKVLNGWNLWNVTAAAEQMLKTGSPLSLRLQPRDGTDNLLASFDIAQSWLYVAVSFPDPAPEEYEISQSELLDAAFSALPEGHWALERYREVAGSLVETRWPDTGVPYGFGSERASSVLRTYSPVRPSRYYKTVRTYLSGFDCASYLHWVTDEAGYARTDSLSDLLRDRAAFFPVDRHHPESWMQVLLPGDLLILDHGTWHVGLILGTPRMYGLTEKNAPELAAFLDMPMMIHCGEDPFVHDRFVAYVNTLPENPKITPPDGGVTVSLLLPSVEGAPWLRRAPWGTDYGYFQVLGQQMTVFPLSDCVSMAWLQPLRAGGER